MAAVCATARQMSHPARPGDQDSDDSRIWLAAIWLLAVQLRHYAKQGFQGRHKPTATKCEISLLSPARRRREEHLVSRGQRRRRSKKGRRKGGEGRRRREEAGESGAARGGAPRSTSIAAEALLVLISGIASAVGRMVKPLAKVATTNPSSRGADALCWKAKSACGCNVKGFGTLSTETTWLRCQAATRPGRQGTREVVQSTSSYPRLSVGLPNMDDIFRVEEVSI